MVQALGFRSAFICISLAVLCSGILACGAPGDTSIGELKNPPFRTNLTAMELFSERFMANSPVNNFNFLPVGTNRSALHRFEGTLSIAKTKLRVAVAGTLETPPDGYITKAFFPSLDIQFVTDGDNLVPVKREIIFSKVDVSWPSVDTLNMDEGELYNHPFWSSLDVGGGGSGVIIDPGKVWSEPSDGGYSRASFPFTLVSRLSGLTRNGLGTFLYDDNGASSIWIQVVQEADPWAMLDMWGQVPMSYRPHEIENKSVLLGKFNVEVARAFPIKPWSALQKSLPSAAPRITRIKNQDRGSEGISLAGLVIDNVIYAHPCRARYGDYPYCQQMRHGVYSFTKTMGAGVAMFWLAQKYGPDVFELRISDFVDIQADHAGWENVTFGHALSMATGVGYRALKGSEGNFNSADSVPDFIRMILQPDRLTKLSVTFELGDDYPWGPGEVARYDSMHTFVLSAAMDTFIKEREGPETDLWTLLQKEVFEPIGVYHLPMMRTVERNGSRGLPLMYSSLYATIDDIAKISKLFHENGRHSGRQLLHAGKLSEALYQTDIKYGLPTGDWGYDYHLSFWLKPSPWWLRDSGCKTWIPAMSGYGGNTVMIMPNGVTAFHLADNWDWDESLVRAVNDVSRICEN